MDTRKLKALLKLHGHTQADLAAIVGCSTTALCNKMTGRSDFTQPEMQKIIREYKLSADQVNDIFFSC
ncbi:MAG: helix-turn-helix transcriptional regulator [Clostridiales bacterium]|nr:helix-turn-helix transcriptional regulator [Candidatus Crickella merdequi]